MVMKIKYLLVLSCLLLSNYSYAQWSSDNNFSSNNRNNYNGYYLIHNKNLSNIIISQLNYQLNEEKLHSDQQQEDLSQMERSLINHDDIAYHYWLSQYNEMVSLLNEDNQNEESLWFEFNQEYNENNY
jgi:hypothetical protein